MSRVVKAIVGTTFAVSGVAAAESGMTVAVDNSVSFEKAPLSLGREEQLLYGLGIAVGGLMLASGGVLLSISGLLPKNET